MDVRRPFHSTKYYRWLDLDHPKNLGLQGLHVVGWRSVRHQQAVPMRLLCGSWMPYDIIELWPKEQIIFQRPRVSAGGKQLENVINVYSWKRAARIQKVPILWHDRELWEWVCDGSHFSHPFIPYFMSKKCKNSFKGKTVFLPVILGFQRSENGGGELSIPQLVTISIPNMPLNWREQRMSRWLIALGIRCQTQLLTELLFVLTCRVLWRRGIITSHRNSLPKAHRLF